MVLVTFCNTSLAARKASRSKAAFYVFAPALLSLSSKMYNATGCFCFVFLFFSSSTRWYVLVLLVNSRNREQLDQSKT